MNCLGKVGRKMMVEGGGAEGSSGWAVGTGTGRPAEDSAVVTCRWETGSWIESIGRVGSYKLAQCLFLKGSPLREPDFVACLNGYDRVPEFQAGGIFTLVGASERWMETRLAPPGKVTPATGDGR